MNGALPPNSIETFFTVPAEGAISCLPNSVEPANVIIRTIEFIVSEPRTPTGC